MSLKAYAKNTAQQFVRLKERILQLWKWIMAATILSLERQTVEICTEISQDLVFAFMWLVNTLYRMMSHCGAAKVEPGCTVFCRAPCVSNPTASTDRLRSDEWEGCVFHIGHVGFLKRAQCFVHWHWHWPLATDVCGIIQRGHNSKGWLDKQNKGHHPPTYCASHSTAR